MVPCLSDSVFSTQRDAGYQTRVCFHPTLQKVCLSWQTAQSLMPHFAASRLGGGGATLFAKPIHGYVETSAAFVIGMSIIYLCNRMEVIVAMA